MCLFIIKFVNLDWRQENLLSSVHTLFLHNVQHHRNVGHRIIRLKRGKKTRTSAINLAQCITKNQIEIYQ